MENYTETTTRQSPPETEGHRERHNGENPLRQSHGKEGSRFPRRQSQADIEKEEIPRERHRETRIRERP